MEPRLRDAVIDSSVAPELDPSLVRALGLPEDFLEEVRRRGVPLRALTVDEGRLAYHPLVRDLLAARLVRERPAARRSQLHAVVAEALEADGPRARRDRALAGGRRARPRERTGRPPRRGAAGDRTGHRRALARAAARRRSVRPRAAAARGAPRRRGGASGGRGGAAARRGGRLCAVRGRRAGLEWPAPPSPTPIWSVSASSAAVRLADGYASSSAVAAPMVALMAAAALGGAGAYREASALFADAAERSAGGPLAPLVPGFHGFFVDLPCGRLDAALAGVRETVAQLERADPFGRLPHVLGMAAAVHDDRGRAGRRARVLRARRAGGRADSVRRVRHPLRARVQGELPCARRAAGRRRAGALADHGSIARMVSRATPRSRERRSPPAAADYDGARASDRVRGARALDRAPACHRSADCRAGRGRPPRSCPRRWWTAPSPPVRRWPRALACSPCARGCGAWTATRRRARRRPARVGGGRRRNPAPPAPRAPAARAAAVEGARAGRPGAGERRRSAGCRPARRCRRAGRSPAIRSPEVRRTAVLAAVASGHPRAVARAGRAAVRSRSRRRVAPARAGRAGLQDRAAAARLHGAGRFRSAAGRVHDRRRRVAAPCGAAARTDPAHAPRRGDERGRAVRGAVAGQGGGRGAPQPPGDRVGRARRPRLAGRRAQRPAGDPSHVPPRPRRARCRGRRRVRARGRRRARRASGATRPRCSRPPRTGGRASRCPKTATKTGRPPDASA